jgi:biopolymer transport protein TolQ
MSLFAGNSMWQLILISDWVSKFVLLVLLGMSIVCWTIFVYKLLLLRIKKQQIQEALREIKAVTHLQELLTLSAHLSKTVPGYLLAQNLSFIKHFAQRNSLELFSERDWSTIQQHADETFDEVMQQEESYVPVLFSSAGVGTLLGLFGTVWGLVHAFIRISEKQSADIAAVAPGIAEALITTLGGLIVAIPAYLMFHYLSVQIRSLEFRYAQFADRCQWILKQIFVTNKELYETKSPSTQASHRATGN